jgi:hypothetical protein
MSRGWHNIVHWNWDSETRKVGGKAFYSGHFNEVQCHEWRWVKGWTMIMLASFQQQPAAAWSFDDRVPARHRARFAALQTQIVARS